MDMDKNGTMGEVQQRERWARTSRESDGRGAEEREQKNESESEKRMTSRRSTADRGTPTSEVRKSGAQPVLAWMV
jgi:hypothetical protein